MTEHSDFNTIDAGRRPRRSRPVTWLALLLALLGAVGLVAHAAAHAEPDHANPPINGTVETAPALLEIWFGEEASPDGLSIQVIGPGGIEVDLGDAKLDLYDPARKHATVSLRPNLGPGVYTVQWQSVSGEDGDAASGSYTFTVTVGGTPVASLVGSPVGSPVAASTPVATVTPGATVAAAVGATDGGDDSNFDSQAFFLSVGVGLVAALAIFGFWRLVRPKNPKFTS